MYQNQNYQAFQSRTIKNQKQNAQNYQENNNDGTNVPVTSIAKSYMVKPNNNVLHKNEALQIKQTYPNAQPFMSVDSSNSQFRYANKTNTFNAAIDQKISVQPNSMSGSLSSSISGRQFSDQKNVFLNNQKYMGYLLNSLASFKQKSVGKALMNYQVTNEPQQVEDANNQNSAQTQQQLYQQQNVLANAQITKTQQQKQQQQSLDANQQIYQNFKIKKQLQSEFKKLIESLRLQQNLLRGFSQKNAIQDAIGKIQFSLNKSHFQKASEYEAQVKKYEASINNYVGQVRDLNAKLSQLQTVVQNNITLQQSNADLSFNMEKIQRENVKMKHDNADVIAKMVPLQQENKRLSQEKQQIQAQVAQLKQQRDKDIFTLQQKQTSPQQLQKLQFENQQFKQQLIKKDQEIQQLLQSQQQTEQKDQQITDLQSENQQLQADLAKVQTVFTKVSQKAQEVDKIKLENDQLKQNILQLQQRNQNRMQPNAAAQQQVQNPQTQPTAQNITLTQQQQILQMQQPVNNLNQPSSHNAAAQQQKQPQQNKQNALPANGNLNINNQQKSANQNPYIDNNQSSMMDQQMMYKTDSANILNALDSISPKQNTQSKASNKPIDPQVNSIIQQQGQLQQQMNDMQKPLNVFQSQSQQLKQNQQQQPLLDQVIQKPKSAEVFKPTVNSTFIKNNENVDPNIQKQFEDSRIQRNKYEMDIKLAINEYNKQQGITIGNEGQQIIYSIQEKLQHFFKQQLILILVDDGKDLQFQNSAIFLNAVRISLLNKWIRQKETQIINYFVPQLEKVKELSDTKVKLNNIRRIGNLQNKMFQTDAGEPTYGLFRCLVVLLVLRMLNEPIQM